jgi:hypothetical protein
LLKKKRTNYGQKKNPEYPDFFFSWSWRSELNGQPAVYDTAALPIELRQHESKWSGRRDSNPRSSAWEADALPLSHARLAFFIL